MDDKDLAALILLTYKGKALLMYKYDNSIDDENHEWTFIRVIKKSKEPIKSSLSKMVMKEAGIKVDEIEFVNDNFYHARLSDNEVNNIKRDELQLLNFFTLNEVRKLTLSPSTKNFVAQHGELI